MAFFVKGGYWTDNYVRKIMNMESSSICLEDGFKTFTYLSIEGTVLRGRTGDNGNLKQLLLLRSEDVPENNLCTKLYDIVKNGSSLHFSTKNIFKFF